MNRQISHKIVLLLSTSSILLFNNCSGFRIDPHASLNREAFFSSRTVFGINSHPPVDQEVQTDGVSGYVTSTGTESGERTGSSDGGLAGYGPGGASIPVGALPQSILIQRACSTSGSKGLGINVMRAIREKRTAFLGYRLSADQPLSCATPLDLHTLANNKFIVLPDCPEAHDPNFLPEISLDSPAAKTLSLIYDRDSSTNDPITVLYALNDQRNEIPTGFTTADFGDQTKCDYKASPLVLQLLEVNQRPRPLLLTSPAAGIDFDILGAQSRPLLHTKHPISWLIPESRRDNYFLTLPNSAGEVLGIDELFGDNTQGPDGKLAANGYEALRKFDGMNKLGTFDPVNRNGFIDAQDAVFFRLRLWQDLNGDGISQPGELFPLNDRGVKSIDLKYDPDYIETDRYGNETRFKSIVEMEDGSANLIYDLWFNLKGS